jgi:hypothetical protein
MEIEAKFCSETCSNELNRSFKSCPECGKSWESEKPESRIFYCNTAWEMCKNCSFNSKRCVVCAKAVVAGSEYVSETARSIPSANKVKPGGFVSYINDKIRGKK